MSDRPLIIGPYRVLSVLGQGGMGVVYRAAHEASGLDVALKTVRVADESLVAGVRREVGALARVGHPGVVRVLDEGSHEGLPWYAMDLLEGTTLRGSMTALVRARFAVTAGRSLAETRVLGYGDTVERGDAPPETRADSLSTVLDAPTRTFEPGASGNVHSPGIDATLAPEADELVRILFVIRRLSVALAYLHGEGIVHRDLKPENVFVLTGGVPVLVDFGLAARFAAPTSRESIDVSRRGAGTIPYISPEQVRGELVDARADIYALGCILYEIVTGRPPFIEGRVTDVVRAHLIEDPVPPSHRVAGVPPALESLVMRLLAKRPSDRIGHAADVAAALEPLSPGDPSYPGAPRARSFVYRPGFAGRKASYSRLERRVAALDAGHGGLVLVAGESGVGKTRLALEVAHGAAERNVRVLAGECLPLTMRDGRTSGVGAAPLQALGVPLDAIADRCRERGRRECDRVFGARARLLAVYHPQLGDLPGVDEYPEPAALTAEAARLRVYRYVEQVLVAVALEDPILLVLDDLQWADELTLGLLEHLARNAFFDRVRVLVLGTYRAEEVNERLAALRDAPAALSFELGRLGEADVAAIVGDMLSLPQPPPRLSRFLSGRSEGNPFFVAEYLRAAVEEGLLARDASGRWVVAGRGDAETDFDAIAMPGSLRELVARRLRDLPKDALAVAQAAAVLGREAAVNVLERLAGVAGVQSAVAELLRRYVVEEATPGVLRFSHDKIHELAYEGTAAGRRTAIHRAAAALLEAAGIEERSEALAALGRHWERGGDPERARGYYLRGARIAASQWALAEAARLYRAFLDLSPEPSTETVAARNELGGRVLKAQGRMVEALAEHDRALTEASALADAPGVRASLKGAGDIHLDVGRLEYASVCLERALALAREAGDGAIEVLAMANLAIIPYTRGEKGEARVLFEELLAVLRARGNRELEGNVTTNYALLHQELGDLERASGLLDRALEIHRQVGNRSAEGMTLMNLGILHKERGETEAADAIYERALATAREIGDRRFEGMVLMNLASLREDGGRSDDARRLYARALEIHREVANRRFEGITLTNLGNVAAAAGRVEEATALYERALAIERQIGDRKFEGITLGDMATLERRAGRLEAAEALLDRSDAITSELGDPHYLTLAACRRGHLALARGASAVEHLALARRRAGDLGAAGPLAAALAALARAERIFAEGGDLLCGEAPKDVPVPLRSAPGG